MQKLEEKLVSGHSRFFLESHSFSPHLLELPSRAKRKFGRAKYVYERKGHCFLLLASRVKVLIQQANFQFKQTVFVVFQNGFESWSGEYMKWLLKFFVDIYLWKLQHIPRAYAWTSVHVPGEWCTEAEVMVCLTNVLTFWHRSFTFN